MLSISVRALLWLVCGTVFLAGYLAIYAGLVGAQFLPSPMWAKVSLWIVLPLTLFSSVFLLSELKRQKTGRFRKFGQLRKASLYVLGVMGCFGVALLAVTNGVPMLLSQFKGVPMQFEYTVTDPVPKH